MPFTIAVIQDHAVPDLGANVTRAEQMIRKAVAQGAQIVCLKELFNAPYFCKKQKIERFDLAESATGKTVTTMQSLAEELAIVIVVPIFERQAAGLYRNSAAVIDADGTLLGLYRKMHIPDDPLFNEKYYFAPGDSELENKSQYSNEAKGFKVWKTRYATIGVLICWDQWYPEAARITSLLGAQVLFYPTAIGWHPSEKDEWGVEQVEAWRTIQRSHAIANGVYVASVNRIGHEDEPGTDGITFFGNSFICDPFGRCMAESGENEEILLARCDPALIERVRRDWPFLRDRRVDSYEPILGRYLDK
mgnify:FL=1|tara:strand:+ start:428 stop:1342 length:915 start_codon:yes stop_codon:yes gene_type:complete